MERKRLALAHQRKKRPPPDVINYIKLLARDNYSANKIAYLLLRQKKVKMHAAQIAPIMRRLGFPSQFSHQKMPPAVVDYIESLAKTGRYGPSSIAKLLEPMGSKPSKATVSRRAGPSGPYADRKERVNLLTNLFEMQSPKERAATWVGLTKKWTQLLQTFRTSKGGNQTKALWELYGVSQRLDALSPLLSAEEKSRLTPDWFKKYDLSKLLQKAEEAKP